MRVSVTSIEQYRKVCLFDWASEQELIAQIKREPFEPRWQMIAGGAWQKILEKPEQYEQTRFAPEDGSPYVVFEADGYTFPVAAVGYAIKALGPGLCEVKATKDFQIGSKTVTVVAQADHVYGSVIQDNKAKFGAVDVKDYEQDLQWRFYLLVHGAKVFQYNLCDFKPPDLGWCELVNIISPRFYAYEGIEADCMRWLRRFLEWAEFHKLLPFLEREGSTPEKARPV